MIIGFDITFGALFGAFVSGYGFALVIFVSADYLARRYFGKKEEARVPDVGMCLAHHCSSRLICYRYMAIPGKWQDYVDFNPGDSERCVDFKPIEGRRVRAAPDREKK